MTTANAAATTDLEPDVATDLDPESAPVGGPTVLVGVDGSAESKLALRWADFLARATGGHVEALMAWPEIPSYAWAASFSAVMPLEAEPEAVAEKVLTHSVDEVFGANRPRGLVLTVVRGGAAEVLLGRAKDVQMLVVGSRGHGGFTGLLIGSVSAACTEHATCPVLVLHGDSHPPA